ncbi:MAG: DUF1499 domain-containing protein [Rhodospirillales bacterium]|nr:MAG: DUF1499 domain-containing protein [Rhodospirillales bacterium]
MPLRRPPSPAKTFLARCVFAIGWLGAAGMVAAGPLSRGGWLRHEALLAIFVAAAVLGLAAIVGGLALAPLLPTHERRATAASTLLGWLFHAAVVAAFAAAICFVVANMAPTTFAAVAPPATLLATSAGAAVAAVVLGILWSLAAPRGATRPGLLSALFGVALGVAAAWVPMSWKLKADSLPRLHEISTDLDDPPKFAALLGPRADAQNPPEHGGAEVARRQREGYPDIAPLTLPRPPAEVMARIDRLAREAGWTVVASDAAGGRLEAVARSRWFGFSDDIVVRVVAAGGGARVDMRSKSRVGVSDLGVNAARVRAFLARLRDGG